MRAPCRRVSAAFAQRDAIASFAVFLALDLKVQLYTKLVDRDQLDEIHPGGMLVVNDC